MFEKKEKKQEEIKEEKKAKKPKKRKDHTLRKNTAAKFLRFVLWGMLIFLTVRGIVTIARPDQTEMIKEQMKQLESNTNAEIQQNMEILSFAEEFVREWQTYTDEAEFKSRLASYVVPAVLEEQDIHDFISTSKVTYVNAYRQEAYSADHYDVYVEVTSVNTRLVEVEPETGVENAAPTQEPEARTETVNRETTKVLKVPVQVTEDKKYIAEGVPLVVDDQEYLPGKYQKDDVQLEGIEDVSVYQETITNYLKAYFSESTSVVEYYLSPEAPKEKLYGFSDPGSVVLVSVDEVRAYRKSAKEVLCLVKYRIQDLVTQEVSLQRCNMSLDDSEVGRLYIKDMSTKTFNLKTEVK